jgi:hypothetical protein
MNLQLPDPSTLSSAKRQRGVATLVVTLCILIILTIIILASTNVALFEQKTATNENRARLAEQAAEYALNIGGEYLKANVSKISTNAAGGWLAAGSLHWISCAGITDTTHPCLAERNGPRRAQMYYYSSDGLAHTSGSARQLDLGYDNVDPNNSSGYDILAPASIKLATTGVGGTTAFGATARVRALLCRIDTTLSPATCQLTPAGGRRIAVTLVSEATMAGEQSASVVKESWGTISTKSFSSATPLVAAGTINIVGTFTIVAAPNAGGYGVAASVWSPSDAGGNGSWQTCHVEDYLGTYDISLLTSQAGCADIHANPKCLCDSETMSVGGAADGVDILDKDGGGGVLPDITFFPGSSNFSSQANRDLTRMDYRLCTATSADCAAVGVCPTSHPGCLTDDNLFEWTFGTDVTSGDTTVIATNCSVPSSFDPGGTHPGDCELKALYDLGFAPVANCNSLDANSSGLIYVTGSCDLKNASNNIGTPSKPVVLVVDNDVTLGHTDNFFGMLFIRSPPSAPSLNSATISGNANGKWFGSVVMEGTADHLNGTMDLVYMDVSAGGPNDPLSETTRFARLPGSWLDNSRGF